MANELSQVIALAGRRGSRLTPLDAEPVVLVKRGAASKRMRSLNSCPRYTSSVVRAKGNKTTFIRYF